MIETARAEVWSFFKKEIAPLIREGKDIEAKTKNAFSPKYVCTVRKYGDTTRVSMNLKGNGIIYFMAETLNGKADYSFKEPSYLWRESSITP